MIDDTKLEQEVVQTQEAPTEQPTQQETEAERNFSSLRQEKARIEQEKLRFEQEAARIAKERDDYARRFKELESKVADSESTVGDDDIVEGRHMKALKKQQYALEEKLRDQERRLEEVNAETRIKMQYPDFDRVLTNENIQKLMNDYPEIASTLASTPDKYSARVSAYKIIKQFNIDAKDPYMEEKQRIHENSLKPKSASSVAAQQGNMNALGNAKAFQDPKRGDKETYRRLAIEMREAQMEYQGGIASDIQNGILQ